MAQTAVDRMCDAAVDVKMASRLQLLSAVDAYTLRLTMDQIASRKKAMR